MLIHSRGHGPDIIDQTVYGSKESPAQRESTDDEDNQQFDQKEYKDIATHFPWCIEVRESEGQRHRRNENSPSEQNSEGEKKLASERSFGGHRLRRTVERKPGTDLVPRPEVV